jgi:hypothetical protein
MARLIDGKAIAATIREDIKKVLLLILITIIICGIGS